MKTCTELLRELDELTSQLPRALHQKIIEGQTVEREECGKFYREALLAVALWAEIRRRVDEFPDYSRCLQ